MSDGGWDAARALVMRYGWNAVSYQLLNPGMRHWFSRAGDAVAGYVSFGGTWVVAGAPVCASDRLATAAAELEADAAVRGARVLYFAAGERLERAYAERPGHSLVRLGAQPVWDPAEWSGILARKASLRAQVNRARNKHVQIEEWPASRAGASERLRAVLHEWLATRGLPPLSFLVLPDILDTLDDRRTFVAERDGRVVGFLIGTPVPARHGWLVEEWPRTRDAPNGTTHSLVDAAMRAFAADGASYVTLGLAPLAEHGGGTVAGQPGWLRAVLRWVRAHGRRFYNFAGLEAFKAGMQPREWEPIYAIAPGGRFTPRMLRAVAGAFSAGNPELLVGRAVWSGAREELRRWRARRAGRSRAAHDTPTAAA